MTIKIIYFTAGQVPTTEERAELTALYGSIFNVSARSGANDAALKFNDRYEACDFVAGTVPDSYSTVPVWTGEVLPATKVVVTDQEPTKVTNSDGTVEKDVLISVADGVLHNVKLTALDALVSNGDVVAGFTITVQAGKITAIVAVA